MTAPPAEKLRLRRRCMRCGIDCHGKVCMDCRETDPTWFALTDTYHPRHNPSGGRVSPERYS